MKNTFKISIFLSFWFYSVEPLLIQRPPWGQNKVAIVERWPLWRGWNKSECMDCPRKKKRFVVESWPLVPEVRLYSLLITAHAHRSQETVYEVRWVTRTFLLRSRCTEPMYKIKLRSRPKLENTISAWASHYNSTYMYIDVKPGDTIEDFGAFLYQLTSETLSKLQPWQRWTGWYTRR